MLSGFIWGQRPIIHPLTGGFNFENQTLDFYPSTINFTPVVTDGCSFNPTQTYKYFSFEANFDMVFAFDLKAKVPDFKFLTWKLTKGKVVEDVFVGNSTTIKASRSVEGSMIQKGMKEGDANSCETYSTLGANGYAKAFEGSELLEKGEIVIIAVYGGSTSEPFDIKVNVAEERTITTFNNLCFGNSYTYKQIYDGINNHVTTNPNPVTNPDIKIYTDNTFSTVVGSSASFNTDTTLYAQVRDAAGNLKYIYTIPLKFIPDHVFNFKSNIDTEYACTTIYTIPSQIDLLNKLFDVVDGNYSISSIVVDGTNYTPGQTVTLTVGQSTSMKIKVHYGGSCPIDSNEVLIPLVQGEPTLSGDISDTTCNDPYTIDFDRIYSKLGVDKNAFDLIVTLGGTSISNGQSTPITTTLIYEVKIKSKSGGGCESDPINFVVTKTQPANITNHEIKDICLADFTQSHIDDAITTIQNGNTYHLRFYQADGITEIVESNLLNDIKTTKNGKIIVKALAADNGNTICDTEKELKFKLDESSFVKVDDIPMLHSSCSEVGAGHTFTVTEIEDYLKNYFRRTDITFNGIIDEFLVNNQSKTITFQVKINGESCWSEEMTLKLQVITKPNVQEAISELQADCNDKITIDAQVLSDLFGANSIIDYTYDILHNNSTPLIFVRGKATVKVHFKNKLDNFCFVEKEIIINEKLDLIVDVHSLETYTQANPIVFCEGEDEDAKNQIQAILNYINGQEPGLVAQSSVDEIFAQIDSENGFIPVVFEDPNFCGTVTAKFYYERNTLPDFNIPTSAEICSATKYELDFEQLARDKGLDVTQYDFSVVGDEPVKISTYQYELGVGDYTITIKNIDSGCPKVFNLKLAYSETPIIEKITINEKSLIVSTKSKGKLEYALFDSTGKIIVDWQTSNELIIPSNITDNDFTVKVRLNGCGISERKDIIYLALPNVVTPNNDGYNDIWKPMTKNGKVNDTSNSYKFIIFDRYGKHILSQEGIGIIEWDGTHNGKPVADGTYWYLLEFSKQSEDLQVLYSGSILVKRKIN